MRDESTPMKRDDDRRYPRKAVQPGYGWVTVSCGGRSYEGHIYDISMGGMRFELDDAVPAGAAVQVRMHLPTGEADAPAINARGKVVRFHDPDELGPVRMGLAFTALAGATDRKALLAFLNRRESTNAVA